MAISRDYLNTTIAKLQVMHSRYADEMCNILKRHTGRMTQYDDLNSMNNLVGYIIDILYNYEAYGISELNDASNGLTEEELQACINYSYRVLSKYGAEIYVPTNPNIYL